MVGALYNPRQRVLELGVGGDLQTDLTWMAGAGPGYRGLVLLSMDLFP